MSNPVSSFASASASGRRRKRPLLKLFLLGVALVSLLAIPPFFRGLVWTVLQEEGFRQGSFVRIEKISGSLWEPLVLERVRWSSEGFFRGRMEVKAERVICTFRWENLLRSSLFWRFWERLEVKGLRVEWEEQLGSGLPRRPGEFLRFGPPLRLWIPDRMRFEVVAGSAQGRGWGVRLEEGELEVSEFGPGKGAVGKLSVQVPGWERVFRDLKTQTSLKGGRLNLGRVGLGEGLELAGLMVDLSELEQGKLSLETQAKAFGGDLRVQGVAGLESSSGVLELSSTFSKIGVAPLAAFLGVTEAAGGVLEEGKFSFRGSPRAPRRGTGSLRLEARNFQWESRQWDSLVVGATLLDRRVQVPEFLLRQGHNELKLSGDVLLPGGEVSWWRGDFGMNVTARIGDLTELSALLLPEFKYTAGTLSVDGAVRSQDGVLGGALILTGSKLMWRKAPIEELNAAIKLEGNDIRILSAQLVNRADQLKAKGIVRVGPTWWYDGELKAAVGDLGHYADLFQTRWMPEAVSGQAVVDWSGKGSAWGHEGRIQGRFSGLRPLKARPDWSHPLQGDFEGRYGAEGLHLESVSLGDGGVTLRGQVKADWAGAQLSGLSLNQGDRVALEGTIRIPAAMWLQGPKLAWPEVWREAGPVELNLRLDRLNLEELARLPGLPRGWRGEVSGQWETQGLLSDGKGRGWLSMREGAGPLGGEPIREVGAELKWEGRHLEVGWMGWRSASGFYEGSGSGDWKEGRQEPEWSIRVGSKGSEWSGVLAPVFGPGVGVVGDTEFLLSGAASDWKLQGAVRLHGLNRKGLPELRWFWAEPSGARRLPAWKSPEWLRKARLNLKLSSVGEGWVLGEGLPASRVDLQVSGTGEVPEIKGQVRLSLAGQVGGTPVVLETLELQFPGGGVEPKVEARAVGLRGAAPFRASAVGPLSKTVREYQAQGPLSPESVRSVFEEGKGW